MLRTGQQVNGLGPCYIVSTLPLLHSVRVFGVYHGVDMGLFSGSSKSTDTLETRKFHNDYGQLLADGEIIEAGFTVLRDTFLFTNKRLILVEVQGISGKQTEYLSMPYSSIRKFSVSTGGSFDLNAELKLWVGSDTIPLEKKFNKDVNVYEVQKILAGHVLK